MQRAAYSYAATPITAAAGVSNINTPVSVCQGCLTSRVHCACHSSNSTNSGSGVPQVAEPGRSEQMAPQAGMQLGTQRDDGMGVDTVIPSAAGPSSPAPGPRGRVRDSIGSGRRGQSRQRVRRDGHESGPAIQPSDLTARMAQVEVRDEGGHCPVRGCFCSEGMGHPPWGSDQALKTHIDSHLLGVCDGEVPDAFMRERGWVACSVCGKSASRSRRGGVHERCAQELRASALGGRDEWAHLSDDWEQGGWAQQLRNLPTMADIFTASSFTREFTYKGLLGLYRQEYGKLCARAIQFNRGDAWDYLPAEGGNADTPEKKRCRVAWMCCETF